MLVYLYRDPKGKQIVTIPTPISFAVYALLWFHSSCEVQRFGGRRGCRGVLGASALMRLRGESAVWPWVFLTGGSQLLNPSFARDRSREDLLQATTPTSLLSTPGNCSFPAPAFRRRCNRSTGAFRPPTASKSLTLVFLRDWQCLTALLKRRGQDPWPVLSSFET